MLKEISIDECREFLMTHYGEDSDLINTYHIASGSGVKGCVDRTMSDLSGCIDLRVFKIDDSCVFGMELDGDYLNLIYIRPQFRNKDSMGKIWSTIRSTLSKKFVTALHNKNTRAINFYLKNKGIVLNKTSDATIIGFGE